MSELSPRLIAGPFSFAGIWSYPANCTTLAGYPAGAVEEFAPGSPGLQYLGGGNWQVNWKTPKSYSGMCRMFYARLNSGQTSPLLAFKFK